MKGRLERLKISTSPDEWATKERAEIIHPMACNIMIMIMIMEVIEYQNLNYIRVEWLTLMMDATSKVD